MSNLKQPVLGFGEQPTPWTPSPFGMLDHGDPSLRDKVLGGTPGTTGLHDPGDPLKNPALGGLVPAAGGKVDSDAATMALAIEIFRASAQSKTKMGVRILKVLDEAYRLGRLSYETMGEDGECTPSEGTIRITRSYDKDALQTSVWLVHEAYHVAVKDDKMLYVDEEVESRQIQGAYWNALLKDGVVLPDGRKFQVKEKDAGKQVLVKWQQSRIIDWVVTAYEKVDGFSISADWIVKHKADGKGFANREAYTREYFARILVESQPTGAFDPRPIDQKVAITLLELLESVNRFDAGTLARKVGKDEVLTILGKLPASEKKRVDTFRKESLAE